MRLIDADTIKDYIFSRWGCDPAYYNDPEAEEAFRILGYIEECPTAEAIPLEFLEDVLEEEEIPQSMKVHVEILLKAYKSFLLIDDLARRIKNGQQ